MITVTIIIKKIKKTQVEIFKIMGGNIPGGCFLIPYPRLDYVTYIML